MRRLLACALLLPLVLTGSRVQAQMGLVFDDSSPDRIQIGTSSYLLTLSKTNGAVLDLLERAANAHLTRGSNGGCLWGSVLSLGEGTSYLGGCTYSSTGANRFAYSWDASARRLKMSYIWASGMPGGVDATVTLTAGDVSFDLRIALHNHSGSTVQNVILPSELLVPTADVQAGYVPYYLPGVKLGPGFFANVQNNVPTYPSGGVFADYLALDVNGGHLAFYTVTPPPTLVQPVAVGFTHNESGACSGAEFCTYHSFYTWVRSGDAWSSPVVRVHVGSTAEQTIQAYRTDNGVADYPSLADKLGSRLGVLARAPLIKADAAIIGKPFRGWVADLRRLPRPSLIHPVTFWPGGFDRNYPDFLPPGREVGTTRDFRAMVEAAHRDGHLVMPYTNPTWWDGRSPTMQHLPDHLTRAEVSVHDRSGLPVTEVYNGNTGYDVSPSVAFVQQRLNRLMRQWRNQVPMDCIFEDQIGARPWLYDFNRASPDPLAYSQAWLEHTARYADWCLMTEDGWDRLARTEIGFQGSLLMQQREFNFPDQTFGAGNWTPYPLALWLFHDKVLFYQHDLSHTTMLVGGATEGSGMDQDIQLLTWNMAFGTMLSYLWTADSGSSLDSPWLSLAGALQRDVAARYAGRPLTGYRNLSESVTESDFGDVQVLANWSGDRPYEVEGFRLAPNGFLARTGDDSVLAGAFTGLFDGHALSQGVHFLVVDRAERAVTVRQPIGRDSQLLVAPPKSAPSGVRLRVTAFTAAGKRLGEVRSSMQSGKVRFAYHQRWRRQRVAYYTVESTAPS